MNRKPKFTTYRVIGSILVLTGVIACITISDEFRHLGELLGVAGILVSGIVFLLIDFNFRLFQKIELQWVSIFLLASIPFGGIILDNMPVGICIGLLLGIAFAVTFGKIHSSKSSQS